jgi:hypothetical protein
LWTGLFSFSSFLRSRNTARKAEMNRNVSTHSVPLRGGGGGGWSGVEGE